MSEDRDTYAAREVERRRQHEAAEDAAFADRMQAQEAQRLGLPSPRVRELSAGPLTFHDGPKMVDTRWIRTAHYIPARQSHHKLDAACWCGPTEQPRDADGGRSWNHHATLPAERRIEAAQGDVAQTAELLDDARRRGER